MTYPDIVRAELDAAIAQALKDSSFAVTDKSFRKRKMTREDVIQFILFMTGGSLQKELHEAGFDISAPSFIQRRQQINSEVFADILQNFNRLHPDAKTYRGYRLFAVDGTTINMARNPQSPCFVCHSGAPDGFNQMHATPLFDVLNKTYFDCVLQPQPRQDEIGALLYFLAWHNFEEKTLVIGDKAFSSYNLFAHFQKTPNVDFLIRVKQGRGAMREVAKLPMTRLDRQIFFTVSTTQTKEDKEKGHILLQVQKNKNRAYSPNTRAGRWDFPSPYPMTLRIVRFMLNTGEYETLATSLPPSVTLEEIKHLYYMRWGIETSFRTLKYHHGIINLHSRTDDGARQEILAAIVTSNVCSKIVNEVIIRQKEENIYQYQVNMKMAIHLCKKFFRTPGADGEQLMRDIAKYVEPVRPGRQDSRKGLKSKNFCYFTYRVAA